MNDAFFRAGVGAVVLDASRHILTLKRKGVEDGAWQMPQGGIGANELPIEALYRELNEEVGIVRADVEVLKVSDEWMLYELPINYRNAKVGWGQAQRWFLCRLWAPREVIRPDQIEFTDVDWTTADQVIERAVSFRIPIYKRLISEFGLELGAV